MSTVTASQAQSQVRNLHAGENVAWSQLTDGTTRTASSVFLLVKVPNQSWITDAQFYVDDGGAGTTWKFGVHYLTDKAATESALHTETSLSATVTASGGAGLTGLFDFREVKAGPGKIPFYVSFTATENVTHAWVSMVNTAVTSASASIRAIVRYIKD